MNHGLLAEVVQLEIPARPEFVGIARMAVAALAGLRTGFSFERIDDLRLVVSEACTAAIERLAERGGESSDVRLRLRCVDDPECLTIVIAGPPGCFDEWLTHEQSAVARGTGADDDFRASLVSALVDEAEAGSSGEELRLVLLRSADDSLD